AGTEWRAARIDGALRRNRNRTVVRQRNRRSLVFGEDTCAGGVDDRTAKRRDVETAGRRNRQNAVGVRTGDHCAAADHDIEQAQAAGMDIDADGAGHVAEIDDIGRSGRRRDVDADSPRRTDGAGVDELDIGSVGGEVYGGTWR